MRAIAAGLIFCCVLAAGCAHFRPPKPSVAEDSPPLAQDEQSVVADYEQRRDEAELQAARTRAEHGDLSGCHAAIQNLLQRNPAHREARLLMADVQLARENTRAAEQLLTGLVRDFPQDAASHHALALLYESTGRAQLARTHFERAAQLAPHDPLVALSAMGNSDATSNVATIAAAAATIAVATPTPEAAAARAVIAAAQTPTGQQAIREGLRLLERADVDSALTALRKAGELESQNVGIPLTAAIYLLRVEKPDAAIVLLEAAADRLQQSSAILRGLGAAYLQAGDLQAAQVVLQQAISLDSSDALAYFLVGQVLQLQGQFVEARAAMRSAAQLDPRYAEQR